MILSLDRPDTHRLIAHLREGEVNTEVVGWNPSQAASHLRTALDVVQAEGYAEFFWPEPTGHYWWMLKREDTRLEVVVLWSRSSAVGWQHVFRAADEFGYLRDLFESELTRVGLTPAS